MQGRRSVTRQAAVTSSPISVQRPIRRRQALRLSELINGTPVFDEVNAEVSRLSSRRQVPSRDELLRTALSAMSNGFQIDIHIDLRNDAWDAIDTRIRDMSSGSLPWWKGVEDLTMLASLLERLGTKDSARAQTAIESMHTAVHTRFTAMTAARSFVKASAYRRDFDDFVKASAILFTMITDGVTSALCCPSVVCMAMLSLKGQSGIGQMSLDAPVVLITECIDEILIVPDGEDADIFICVTRDDIVRTSYDAIMCISNVSWCNCQTLDVCFEGETGFGEGVVRDWIGTLSIEFFYKSGYFEAIPRNPSVLHPKVTTDKKWMDFAGRILGISIRLGIPVGVHLTRASFAVLTERSVGYRELHEIDPFISQSLRAINDTADIASMHLDGFRGVDGTEMFPGGGRIDVTAANKGLYVEMVMEVHVRRVSEQCLYMLAGIMHVFHGNKAKGAYHAIRRMRSSEFNRLIGGGGIGKSISTADWKAHTIVEPPGKGDVIFDMIEAMTHDGKMLLLRFWTGLHCLPVNGFGGLSSKLRLIVDENAPIGRLPTVHTCLLSMAIPAYVDIEDMKTKFTMAMSCMEIDD